MKSKKNQGTQPTTQTVECTRLVLVNGHWVEERLFKSVCTQVGNRLPLLWPDVAYSARKLCGGLFWEQLSSGDQKKAGHCVSDLVNQGELPMRKTARTPQNALQYCLV